MAGGNLTVVVGPVQQGRDEILEHLHCNVCRTLDGGPSVILPLMAVAAAPRRLNMKSDVRSHVESMTLEHPQITFSNPGTLDLMPAAALFG